MNNKVGRPRIDLVGQRFGRLTVVSDGERSNKNRLRWKCLCDCGNETTVQSEHLKDHSTTSCGCFAREQVVKSKLTHGYTRVGRKVRLFSIWNLMLSRCDINSSYPRLKDYAGRGIGVCEEWLDYETFAAWSNHNGYSDILSLDRINNDGNYEPDNCRWTTNKAQARNRRSNRMVTIDGETKCLIEWTEVYGINYGTAKRRLNSGWDSKKALTHPVQTKRHK